jgi:hypothetical protein
MNAIEIANRSFDQHVRHSPVWDAFAYGSDITQAVGYQAKLASDNNADAKFRDKNKAAVVLHKQNPGREYSRVNLLNDECRKNEFAAFFLTYKTAKKIDRSIFTENIGKFDEMIKQLKTEILKSNIAGKRAFETLQDYLKGFPQYKTELADLGEFDTNGPHLDKMIEALEAFQRNHPAPHADRAPHLAGKLLSHLKTKKDFNLSLEEAELHRDCNKMLRETMRNGSYRAISRYIGESARSKLMMWLNVIGMITMILTIPLMVEGLQQFAQSLHHPDNQGQ